MASCQTVESDYADTIDWIAKTPKFGSEVSLGFGYFQSFSRMPCTLRQCKLSIT